MEPIEMEVPVDRIKPPAWNSRTVVDVAKVKSLMETIKTQGQKQAIEVEIIDGTVDNPAGATFELVFGSRRLQAMRMGGFDTIRARVKEPSSETARILSNALENVQREDLTTYEKARVCSTLREKGLSLKEAVEATGWSQTYISNLAVCFNGLHPEILADWAGNNDNDEETRGPAVVSYLRTLVKEKDKDKQVETWKAYKASFNAAMEDLYDDSDENDDSDDDDDDKDGAKSKPKNYTVKRERYNALIRALKAAKSPAIALHAVQYLIGKYDRIKGLPGLGPDDKEDSKSTKDKE